MTPTITMLLFVDVEKEPRMLKRFYESLSYLNSAGWDALELFVLCQGDQDTYAAPIGVNPIGIQCGHDKVNDYPVWDVMEVTRRVWPEITGEYVTWAHPEFFLCPDRLRRTAEFLKSRRPHLAMGNLRRPGSDPGQWKFPSCSRDVSDVLTRAIDLGDWERVRDYCEIIPTREWMYWSPPPKPGNAPWLEDIFFARKDWLEAVGFVRDYGPMPFQDVYDLMGAAADQLRKRGLTTDSVRLSRETHQAIHLWHPKAWSSFTPAMRDYFKAHAGQYADTRFVDWALWERLISCRGVRMPKNEQPVLQLRRGPKGTVTRFSVGIADWLAKSDAARTYYTTSAMERARPA